MLRIHYCKRNNEKALDDFFIREWGGDRGNVWETRRENNGGVKDGNKPVFKEVGWQAQGGGREGSMVETIPPP